MAVLITMLVTTGCGGGLLRSEPAPPPPCAPVHSPLAAANPYDSTEPLVEIPQLPGWAPSPAADEPYARLVLENPAMADDGVTPTVVVRLAAMEIQPGPENPSPTTIARNILDSTSRTRAVDLHESGMAVRSRSHQRQPLCGFPAQRRDYTMTPTDSAGPARRVSDVDAVLDIDGHAFLLNVTVRGPETNDEAYRLDADRILRGVQIRPQR